MNFLYQQQDSTVNNIPLDTVNNQHVAKPADTLKAKPADTLEKRFSVKKNDSLKKIFTYKKKLQDSVKLKITQDTVSVNSLKPEKEILTWNNPEILLNNLYLRDSLKTSLQTDSTKYLTKNGLTDRKKFTTDWTFWLLVVILFLFLWVRLFYKKYFNVLLRSSVNYHTSSKLYNEKNVLAKRVSLVLNFIYTIVLGAFLFQIGAYFNLIDKTHGFNYFLILLNIVILVSIIKVILHKITGYIFNISNIISEYLHNIYVINKSLGIILFPFTFAAFFSSGETAGIITILGVIVLALSLIIKIVRSGEIIIQNGILNFYSILYLCTLEILPFIIVYRFIKSFI